MWKKEKLEAQIKEVLAIKDYCMVSGGLAWHLMSPSHEERKFVHDHKDVDLFIFPDKFNTVAQIIKSRGFNRYFTKYDTNDFYRYGLSIVEGEKRVKVLFDLFIKTVPFMLVGDFKVVEPNYLLSLYESTHTSKNCVAVKAARILLARGINPVGRKELIDEKGIDYRDNRTGRVIPSGHSA